MIIKIIIPSPGESITEVQLAGWFVNNGDFVEKDQEIGEIESDKATLPVIAQESGVVSLKLNAGDTAKVGDVACEINTAAKIKTNAVNEVKKSTEEKVMQQTAIKTEIDKASDKKNENDITVGPKNIKVTPVAHKMMEENNLNIDDIINGLKRITAKEVKQVLYSGAQISMQTELRTINRNETRKPLSQLRKKLSERLVAVKNETAMLTTFNEVNMREVKEMRKKYQSVFQEKYGIKLGFMSVFTKAVIESLKLFPKLNSRMENNEIITPEYYDIGIAVQTDKGLMVPVIRNVETLNLAEIELQIAELANKARSNKLSIDEMTGGTFTITNGGIFGSLLSTPILNPPQSGILGMHNIVDRPIAVNGKIEIHPMMYVALSYDHRVIDGKDSVSFLVKIKEFIESPYKMLFGGKSPEEILLNI